MREVQTRIETGPVAIVAPDGRSLVSETTITSYDDWWETPIGRMNFGRVHISRPVHYMVYTDGRKEPTTPMAFAMTALEPAKRREPPKPERTGLTLIIASLIGIASIVLHILQWMGVVGVQ